MLFLYQMCGEGGRVISPSWLVMSAKSSIHVLFIYFFSNSSCIRYFVYKTKQEFDKWLFLKINLKFITKEKVAASFFFRNLRVSSPNSLHWVHCSSWQVPNVSFNVVKATRSNLIFKSHKIEPTLCSFEIAEKGY